MSVFMNGFLDELEKCALLPTTWAAMKGTATRATKDISRTQHAFEGAMGLRGRAVIVGRRFVRPQQAQSMSEELFSKPEVIPRMTSAFRSGYNPSR